MSAQNANCIFCKIIAGELPCTQVADAYNFMAIRDTNPQAPTHVLILPKEHLPSVLQTTNTKLMGELIQAASNIAQSEKLDSGFRLVINTGPSAGQTVDHLHIHLLGGRQLQWPPG